MNGAEQQLVDALSGLLMAVATAVVTYVSVKFRQWSAAHLSASNAATANHVIDGLGKIAEATVQDFNQRVVNDAKEYGVFTPALAAAVKADAVTAIKIQVSPLLALAGDTIGDVDNLISNLVERHVVASKA